jgi:hypothetical protein
MISIFVTLVVIGVCLWLLNAFGIYNFPGARLR